ncbi:neutral amino acid transport system substrate-binding protein [Arthrobacter pascens]|uniref:ABC transporter substrate-binding protein n=1 Tax=Arthrobacter pascens TaxID=1677 RepID=UPI002790C711|nr:ABC transporter substrate-binding protein [Arthrobacter pascens]MDQ0679961.1 neutral amino acid transport system substrate-binding protein [Arthrobacter pascens]
MKSVILSSATYRSAIFRGAAGAAALLALAGCGGVAGNARLDSVEASGDGTLRIGLILDNTGKQAFLNDSQLAAATLAVQEINAAGGHKGKPVQLLPEPAGEGSQAQATELVAAKADVVIGPTDSSNAAGAIDVLSRARVPLISPANSAAGLSKYKNGGYYFRTAAADVAQASVLVKLAKDGGAKSLAVVHQDSGYGKDVSDAVASAAKNAGLDTVSTTAFKPGEARKAAAAAQKAAPDAVVLIARDGAQGAIAELNNAGLSGSRIVLSDGAYGQYGSGLGSKALDGARAVVPGVFPSEDFQARLVAVDPGLKDLSFAAETFDAVNLAVLAAGKADDDAGRTIAANLIAVSGGSVEGAVPDQPGKPCTSFKECQDLLKSGAAINYDGESGPIAFDAKGDITTANFMVFTYGPDNKARISGRESAGRAAG